MRTAAICFCLCLIATQVSAQAEQSKPGELNATGVVVGPGGQPQAGVSLRVEGPQGRTLAVTDIKGKWSLYNLAPGSYKVEPVGGEKNGGEAITFSVKPKQPWSLWFSQQDKNAVAYQAPVIKIDQPN
jgi:hypothetical protein